MFGEKINELLSETIPLVAMCIACVKYTPLVT